MTVRACCVQVALGLLGLFTVQAGLIVGRGVLLQLAGERIAARLRNSVFSSMLDQEVGGGVASVAAVCAASG